MRTTTMPPFHEMNTMSLQSRNLPKDQSHINRSAMSPLRTVTVISEASDLHSMVSSLPSSSGTPTFALSAHPEDAVAYSPESDHPSSFDELLIVEERPPSFGRHEERGENSVQSGPENISQRGSAEDDDIPFEKKEESSVQPGPENISQRGSAENDDIPFEKQEESSVQSGPENISQRGSDDIAIVGDIADQPFDVTQNLESLEQLRHLGLRLERLQSLAQLTHQSDSWWAFCGKEETWIYSFPDHARATEFRNCLAKAGIGSRRSVRESIVVMDPASRTKLITRSYAYTYESQSANSSMFRSAHRLVARLVYGGIDHELKVEATNHGTFTWMITLTQDGGQRLMDCYSPSLQAERERRIDPQAEDEAVRLLGRSRNMNGREGLLVASGLLMGICAIPYTIVSAGEYLFTRRLPYGTAQEQAARLNKTASRVAKGAAIVLGAIIAVQVACLVYRVRRRREARDAIFYMGE